MQKQLTKALPQMIEAARYDQVRELFILHLAETEVQVERFDECSGKKARRRSMQGLVEEGDEVMKEEPRRMMQPRILH